MSRRKFTTRRVAGLSLRCPWQRTPRRTFDQPKGGGHWGWRGNFAAFIARVVSVVSLCKRCQERRLGRRSSSRLASKGGASFGRSKCEEEKSSPERKWCPLNTGLSAAVWIDFSPRIANVTTSTTPKSATQPIFGINSAGKSARGPYLWKLQRG